MNTEEIQAVMQNARKFAARHVPELVREMIEWQDTAILPDGKLRQLARLVEELHTRDSLRVAEHIATRAIFEEYIQFHEQSPQ